MSVDSTYDGWLKCAGMDSSHIDYISCATYLSGRPNYCGTRRRCIPLWIGICSTLSLSSMVYEYGCLVRLLANSSAHPNSTNAFWIVVRQHLSFFSALSLIRMAFRLRPLRYHSAISGQLTIKFSTPVPLLHRGFLRFTVALLSACWMVEDETGVEVGGIGKLR